MTRDNSTDRRWIRTGAGLAVAVLALSGAACGSSSTAGTSTSSTAASTATSSTVIKAKNIEGKRYCEVLLVHPAAVGLAADVYNTYPLNACPEDQWAAMDAKAIATENGVPIAILNGPRFWLMDSVNKVRTGAVVKKSFGGMEMMQQATVNIGRNIAVESAPFTPHDVSRQASFTFNRGRQVYELTAADGTKWVMQTWSQSKDPTLAQADLPGLAPRLTLPAGWTYQARTITSPLMVATTAQVAHVLQDNLQNSYSMETSG